MSSYKCENKDCLAVFKSNHPLICPKCKGHEFGSVNTESVLNKIPLLFYIIPLLLVVAGYLAFNVIEPTLKIKNVILNEVDCTYTIQTNQLSEVDILISTNNKDFTLNKLIWRKDEVEGSNFFYVKKYGSEKVVDYYFEKCKDAVDYFNSGKDYYDQNKFDEAIIELDKSILSDPNLDDDAYYYRGVSYYSLSKYNQAINDLNKSIANWPNYRSPYYYRGLCQLELGNYQEALSDFNKYINLSEIQSLSIDEEYNAYIQRAFCYYKTGRLDFAVSEYTTSINKWPDLLEAYYFRGIINYEQEEYFLAIHDLSKVINGELSNNLEANLFDALDYRGHSYFEVESYYLAKYDFNRLIIENKNAEPALLSSYYRMSGICKEYISEECCSDYKTCCELGDEDCCEWLTIAPCIGVHVTTDSYVNELTKNDNIKIGQKLYGGIIFYIDESGKHGLVAANEDFAGEYIWGCYGQDVLDSDSQLLGSGFQNTLDIGLDCKEFHNAAQLTLNYTYKTYKDWYLPSKDELITMYHNIGYGSLIGNVGKLEGNWYWSSSEYSSDNAWNVYLGSGAVHNDVKDLPLRVRAIRKF